jgi:methylthioribose-1-phosphate isomerase
MLGVVARGGGTPDLLSEAERMWAAEVESNARLGERGGALLGPGSRLLTHCNAGALASAGPGTALSVVRWAWAHGRLSRVWATETRPLFQGSRLTAWELEREGIPVTVIVDSCAPWLMHCGEVDAVVVGADRVAANGDTANKIGTYGLALAARRHGLPFYVAAPTATLDPGTPSGDEVTIEERDGAEVSAWWGRRLTPAGAAVWNPAFDVTPAELVTAIVTERGVARAPFLRSIAALLGKAPA